MAAAAAAYAALVSLSHILHQILNPPPTHHFSIPREQIQSLQEQVTSLINFFEKYSSRRSHGIEDLESQIVAAVYEADDIIESHVVGEIQAKHLICPKMKKFTRLRRKLGESKTRNDVERVGLGNTTEATSSSRSLSGDKNIMVGFDEHLDQIRIVLASDDPQRLIVPIVGMGGIGKTTLATNVYNDPYIVEKFIIRAWVSVSQEYKERDIIVALLQQINSKIEVSEFSADQLGVLLHKELFGRKYLIVLDDMWEFEAWEKLRNFLPDISDGSRILVTTRILSLATDFGSCSPYHMGTLDGDRSWDLIYEYVKDDCPAELEEIGRSIARGCGGLPLALVVIGGLLAKSEKTRDFWDYVNENVTSTANYANDEQCLKILRLSYGELPVHLKPCFLYLAVFPNNFEIRMSRLIRLWVAEGFIKPSTTGKTLEEVAEGYLKDLVDMNLVMISKLGHSGKTLVFPSPISLPSEFWLMPQLRHLKMPGITLADPPEAQVILENLQTLTTVRDFIFSKNALERIPNLIKLGIDCEATEEIESFVSLTKLTLSSCQIPWEDMSVVGSLPNLAVLKLQKRAATGKVWNPNAEGFRQLKFLLIDWCQLEIWEADNSDFPVLECIQLIGVRMEDFPQHFAEIEALRTIDLNYCSRSLFLSAKQMSEDQIQYEFPIRIWVDVSAEFSHHKSDKALANQMMSRTERPRTRRELVCSKMICAECSVESHAGCPIYRHISTVAVTHLKALNSWELHLSRLDKHHAPLSAPTTRIADRTNNRTIFNSSKIKYPDHEKSDKMSQNSKIKYPGHEKSDKMSQNSI
ncbi:hypothetical protein C2S51_010267 [Perilla frutescens var. frutescens]|nr:hypothetical protein C2S51_010267 [Perilla frutescens var. frutescens]